MKEFWNKRYTKKEWAYGMNPSVFLKEKLPLFKTGKILFPAEGEGRNAVYAASLGWEVAAFDFSEEAKHKALELAKENNLNLTYKVASFLEEDYTKESFDVICNVFVHFSSNLKEEMHKRLDGYLKKEGLFIMEVFSKEHLKLSEKNPSVGGPPDAERMYSIDEIKRLFTNYDILDLREEEVYLNEGLYHVGHSSVIRFIGRKK